MPSKSLRNAVMLAFPGLFCILRMCAPRRAAAVVRPRGHEKSADRRRRILISRLLIIRALVPRRKSLFPAYFKGFPAVSPLIPSYPAFLKYPVSPQPFSSNIRSSVRIKQAEKRHFSDPSLACALLKATPAGLIGDLETLGFLFEALCERDLRVYAESFGANLYHYQDYKNQEIDAVLELPNGQWCAFEIKLGANQIDAAAANLLEIKKQILEDPKGKPPAVLGVLCGMSNAAYQRPDGVFVVPITALKS